MTNDEKIEPDGNFIKNEKLEQQVLAEEIIEYLRDRRRVK